MPASVTGPASQGSYQEMRRFALARRWVEKTPTVSPRTLHEFLTEVCSIGPRWHGTAAEEQSIRMMERRLGAVCNQVGLEEFPYAHYVPVHASLEIQNPVKRPVSCIPLQYSKNGLVEGEIVYVGDGWLKDFQALLEVGTSVERKIVLARTNRPYVAGKIASEQRASGIIVISDSPFGTIRQVTSQMGYGKGDDLATFGLSIPGAIIGREDGEALLSLASASEVTARIEHSGVVQVRTSYNVIGYQYGREEPDRKVVIGAHYDTQAGVPGAWDNGSGCAALLEIARVCAQSRPRRTMVFCGFGGEEIGLFGSTAFVRDRIEEVKDVVCYVNLDSTSGDLCYTHELHVTEGVKDFSLDMLNQYGDWSISQSRSFTPLDHEQDSAEFVKCGIEAFWAHEEGNAFFHTPLDTIETVNPHKLARATRASLLPFFYLANAPCIPMDGEESACEDRSRPGES
jgi:aminopeptidase YwaD